VAIFTGAVIIAFSPQRWDYVLFGLPRSHGIHLHELMGMALVAVGTFVLCRSPASA
jgi:hypothetical protein